MECKEAKKCINSYSYGEINQEQINELMKHLMNCEKCRKFFEEMEFINSNISKMFEEKLIPDRDFRKNIMKEINSKSGHKLWNLELMVQWEEAMNGD